MSEDIKSNILSSFISIGRIMAYRAIHNRLGIPNGDDLAADRPLPSPGTRSRRSFDPRRGQGRVPTMLKEADQTSQKDLATMFA